MTFERIDRENGKLVEQTEPRRLEITANGLYPNDRKWASKRKENVQVFEMMLLLKSTKDRISSRSKQTKCYLNGSKTRLVSDDEKQRKWADHQWTVGQRAVGKVSSKK